MLYLLIDIAVLQLLFFIVHAVFTFIISFLALLLKIPQVGQRFSKGVGVIVLGSLSAGIVIRYTQEITNLILYGIVAGLLMLFNLQAGFYNAKKEAAKIQDLERITILKELQYDYVYLIIAILAFITTFFIPVLGKNPINEFLIFLMDWIMDVSIVNWVVSGFAGLMLLSFVYHGWLSVYLAYINYKHGAKSDYSS